VGVEVGAELGVDLAPRAGAHVREGRRLLGMAYEQVGRGGRQPQERQRHREDLGRLQRVARAGIVTDAGESDPRQLGVRRGRQRMTQLLGTQHAGIIRPRGPTGGDTHGCDM
jgi:hypothetical protein